MKKVIQKTGKLLFILLCIVVAFLSLTTIYHHISLGREADSIVPNGILIDVNGYQTHVYAQGEKGNKPTLVFMSGSATVAPVYDFKSLYDVLSHEYRIAVVEKAG
ncbi:MAG: alpha/beta hydrolase, partial [Eubacteriales bacterium]|nr:alpha/beta hydrolase [Eubacteriales bacterium]